MHLLLTPSRLALLFEASPLGIVGLDHPMRADLNELERAGLLTRDPEGVLHLTVAGKRCMHDNLPRVAPWDTGGASGATS